MFHRSPDVVSPRPGLLEAVRESIVSGPYNHDDWNHCLCGHVYKAVADERTRTVVKKSRDPEYLGVLQAIYEANRPRLSRMNGGRPWRLSRMVSLMAMGGGLSYRLAALIMVERAIARLEVKASDPTQHEFPLAR